MRRTWRVEIAFALAANAGVAAVTWACFSWLHVTNATIVALSYLLVVLFAAASARAWIAVATSVVAALLLNFYFLPPIGTLDIDDPADWAAFFAFITVSLVASRLSSLARARERELARLFDFSRDVLLETTGPDAFRALARYISERFQLDYVAISLPTDTGIDRHVAGTPKDAGLAISADLGPEPAGIEAEPGAPRVNDREGAAGARDERRSTKLVPLRHRAKTIGQLEVAGRPIEPATLKALASVVAIAIERVRLLEQRNQAEITERSVALKSALLASLAHDLRTPLTAIGMAVGNLSEPRLTEAQRAEQAEIALSGLDRLTRLFQNLLEMTRIDAGEIALSLRWVHPSEIIQAARSHAAHTLRRHRVETRDRSSNHSVLVDPRLLTNALAHLLENAAQYSPEESLITVTHEVTGDGLLLSVKDEGPGIAASDAPRLFERFYRGEQAHRNISGTGMGLAITRGLLAAEGGRVWADEVDRGARFSILVPAPVRVAADD